MKKMIERIFLACCFAFSYLVGELWFVAYDNRFWEVSPFPLKEIGILSLLTIVVIILWVLEFMFSSHRWKNTS